MSEASCNEDRDRRSDEASCKDSLVYGWIVMRPDRDGLLECPIFNTEQDAIQYSKEFFGMHWEDLKAGGYVTRRVKIALA